MITAEWCRLMAGYGEWMNTRLYATCATLDDDERKRDRGAFFGSIHATLDHIVYADLAFLSRFTGDPPQAPELGEVRYEDFEALRDVRTALDARIVAWVDGLTPDWLEETLTHTSNVDGKVRSVPRWITLTHMFNHATHHRGQVTTLLGQAGLDMGVTDIPFMPRFEARPP